MKKFIFCLVVMFAMVVSANAQITSSKMSSETMAKVVSFNVPWSGIPCGDVIYTENTYLMRLYSANEFSDKCVMIPLGGSKQEAIETLNGLIDIMSKVNKKDNACVNLADGKSITIYKYYDLWYIDQEGVAKGVLDYSTNGFNKKTLEKCIKKVEEFKA